MKITDEEGTEYIYGARNNNAEGIKFKAASGEIVLRLPFPKESGLNLEKFNPQRLRWHPTATSFYPMVMQATTSSI